MIVEKSRSLASTPPTLLTNLAAAELFRFMSAPQLNAGVTVREWILAYDDQCSTCADIGQRVRRLAGCRVTVAALDDDRVTRLREDAFRAAAPWAPTLLRVDGTAVRAWTGFGLSVRLSFVLGLRRSVALVRSLQQSAALAPPVCGQRRRLLQAIPAATVGAFLLSGGLATPARAAQQEQAARVARWVAANRGALPRGYDDLTAQPMAYRRAAYLELKPAEQAELWREQFRRYRRSHPDLTPEQRSALDTADRAVAGDTIDAATAGTAAEELTKAFGRDEAATIIATLGQPDKPASDDATTNGPDGCLTSIECHCSLHSNWCSNGVTCGCQGGCPGASSSGCGKLWLHPCDGVCRY